jgi:hypothetical protein
MTIRKFVELFNEETTFYIKRKAANSAIKLTEEILYSFVGDLNINKNSIYTDYRKITIIVKIPEELYNYCLEIDKDEWNYL